MLQFVRRKIIYSLVFLSLFIIIAPIEGTSDYEFRLLFEASNSSDSQYILYNLDLDGNLEVSYQQSDRIGKVHISPTFSEILIQNSVDDFLVLPVNSHSSTRVLPSQYEMDKPSIVLRWGEQGLISFFIDNNQLVIYESQDYFSTSTEISNFSFDTEVQPSFESLDMNFVVVGLDPRIIATPLIISDNVDRDSSIVELYIWTLNSYARLLQSFENPIEWWFIPQRSRPIWLNETKIAFLTYEGEYQTQNLIIYDIEEDKLLTLHEFTCESCNFISHLTYNEIQEEVIFWQPSRDSGWDLIGVSVEDDRLNHYITVDTTPSPIQISPDGKYLSTTILNIESSLIILDIETKEILVETILTDDYIRLSGWIAKN